MLFTVGVCKLTGKKRYNGKQCDSKQVVCSIKPLNMLKLSVWLTWILQ